MKLEQSIKVNCAPEKAYLYDNPFLVHDPMTVDVPSCKTMKNCS